MTEKQIREELTLIHQRYVARLSRIERSKAILDGQCDNEIRAVQAKCGHRKITRHYGYEVPSYESCDLCGKEFR